MDIVDRIFGREFLQAPDDVKYTLYVVYKEVMRARKRGRDASE